MIQPCIYMYSPSRSPLSPPSPPDSSASSQYKPLARLIKKQREKNKSIKLEMKMERSQQTTLKYKGS